MVPQNLAALSFLEVDREAGGRGGCADGISPDIIEMTLRVCDADRQPQMPTVLGSTCHQQAPPSEPSTCSPPAHRHRRSKGCLVITVLFLLEQRMVSSFPRSHRSALPSLIVGGFVGGSCSTGFVMMPAVRKTTKSMRQLELRNWRNSVRARPEASMALDTEMQIETGELLSRYVNSFCILQPHCFIAGVPVFLLKAGADTVQHLSISYSRAVLL